MILISNPPLKNKLVPQWSVRHRWSLSFPQALLPFPPPSFPRRQSMALTRPKPVVKPKTKVSPVVAKSHVAALKNVREHLNEDDSDVPQVLLSEAENLTTDDAIIELSSGSAGSSSSFIVVRAVLSPHVPTGCVSLRRDVLEKLGKDCFSRSQANVKVMEFRDVVSRLELDHVELRFNRAFISRSDMLTVSDTLRHRIVFLGEEVVVDHVSFTVSAIRHRGDPGRCTLPHGVISLKTIINFESEQYAAVLLFLLTKELGHQQHDGRSTFDWAVEGFIRNLLVKIGTEFRLSPSFRVIAAGRVDANQTNYIHEVAGFLDTRYDEAQTTANLRRDLLLLCQRIQSDSSNLVDGGAPPIAEGDASASDVFSVFSEASSTAFLPALDIALDFFSNHHFDRHLHRTGQKLIVVTGGNGLFRVENEPAQRTSRRVLDVGVRAVSLVCVGVPGRHAVPLFEFSGVDEGLQKQRGFKFDAAMLYYEQPAWLAPYFFTSSPSCSFGCIPRFALMSAAEFFRRHHSQHRVIPPVVTKSAGRIRLRLSAPDAPPDRFETQIATLRSGDGQVTHARVDRKWLSRTHSGKAFDERELASASVLRSHCLFARGSDHDHLPVERYLLDTDFENEVAVDIIVDGSRFSTASATVGANANDGGGAGGGGHLWPSSFATARGGAPSPIAVWNPSLAADDRLWRRFLNGFRLKSEAGANGDQRRSQVVPHLKEAVLRPELGALGRPVLRRRFSLRRLNDLATEEEIVFEGHPDFFLTSDPALFVGSAKRFCFETHVMTVTPRSFTVFTLQPASPYKLGQSTPNARVDAVAVSDMFHYRWGQLFPHDNVLAWEEVARCWLMPVACDRDPFEGITSFGEQHYTLPCEPHIWKDPAKLFNEILLQRLHFNFQVVNRGHDRAMLTIGHQTHTLTVSVSRELTVTCREHKGIYRRDENPMATRSAVSFRKWNRFSGKFESTGERRTAAGRIPFEILDTLVSTREDLFEIGGNLERTAGFHDLRMTSDRLPSRRVRFVVIPRDRRRPVDEVAFDKFLTHRMSEYFALPPATLELLSQRGPFSLFTPSCETVDVAPQMGHGTCPPDTAMCEAYDVCHDTPPLMSVRLQRVRDTMQVYDPQSGLRLPSQDHRDMYMYVTLAKQYRPSVAFDLALYWLVCTASVISHWVSSFKATGSSFNLNVVQVPSQYESFSEPQGTRVTYRLKSTSRLFRTAILRRMMRDCEYFPDTVTPNFNCRLIHHSGLAWMVSSREGLIWGSNPFAQPHYTGAGDGGHTMVSQPNHRQTEDALFEEYCDAVTAAEAVAEAMASILSRVPGAAAVDDDQRPLPL